MNMGTAGAVPGEHRKVARLAAVPSGRLRRGRRRSLPLLRDGEPWTREALASSVSVKELPPADAADDPTKALWEGLALLLANSKALKFGYPPCLLGRQKKRGKLVQEKVLRAL